MNWEIFIHHRIEKEIKKFPTKDYSRIKKTINSLKIDPFVGDIGKMEGEKNVWRRRIGNYRIFYELFPEKGIVFVYKVKRRTTNTY